MNEYFSPDPSMTLGEAIEKMRAAEPEDFANQTAIEIAQLLEQHDAVHILFDLSTSIQDEIAAHLWMALATTANMSQMHHAVASQEHRSVLSGIGHLRLMGIWISNLPRIIGIVFKSLRMNRKVPMEDISQLKHRYISEIRQAYGIVLRT
jgi:hypothetical protein